MKWYILKSQWPYVIHTYNCTLHPDVQRTARTHLKTSSKLVAILLASQLSNWTRKFRNLLIWVYLHRYWLEGMLCNDRATCQHCSWVGIRAHSNWWPSGGPAKHTQLFGYLHYWGSQTSNCITLSCYWTIIGQVIIGRGCLTTKVRYNCVLAWLSSNTDSFNWLSNSWARTQQKSNARRFDLKVLDNVNSYRNYIL